MRFKHVYSPPLLALSLAIIGAAQLHGATAFVSGDVGVAANWTDGLPAPGSPGTIAVGGTLNSTGLNVGEGTTVTQSAGVLTGTPNLYNNGGATVQWTQSGGTISATNFMTINHGMAYELTGTGVINFAATTGGSRLSVVNSGTWTQSGGTTDGAALAFENATGISTLTGGVGLNVGASWAGGAAVRILDATVNIAGSYTATINPTFSNPSGSSSGVLSVEGTGVLNFSTNWSGSLTQNAFAGTSKWIDALTQTGVQVEGTQVTASTFGDFFETTNNGSILRRSSGPSATTSRDGLTAIDASGDLTLDRQAWLARNNLVYLSPPFRNTDAIPLGSGRVGAAMWIDPTNGLTIQLNRPEGVPALAGLGTLQISNLSGLVSSQDYQGVLSLHDGVFTQHAGGFTVTSFFRWGGEELVIDVQGADPEESVTVKLNAYSGGIGHGGITTVIPLHAIASETPANETTGENCIAIASGDGTTAAFPGFRATQFFAARAVGRQIVATADANGATLTFKPNPNGSYRLVVPVKIWSGLPVDTSTLKPEALAAVMAVPGLETDPLPILLAERSAAFGAMWDGTAIIRLRSQDDSARYIEQMLAIDSYLRISAALTPLPAVGGGETRLFGWHPVGVFNRTHWYQNLRPINYANMASGVWRGNAGTWDWLLSWLPTFQQHVTDTFPGYEGAGYPEYLDGQPGTAGSLMVSEFFGQTSIAPEGQPWYSNRIMSVTPETVAALITEYRYRQDDTFLDTYWPLIHEGMLFHRSLLMDGGLGDDGRYHFLHVNARENNWDDTDDTPDVANIRHLLPLVIDLAQQRGDTNLVTKLNDLVGKLPELPTNTLSNKLVRLNFPADHRTHPDGPDVMVIDWSAASHGTVSYNAENPDLDAIWPANLISDASDPGLITLANDTLDTRIYRENYDWLPTAVQAARMGRTDIYKDALLRGIAAFMMHPQGLHSYNGGDRDVQTEFTAVQTLAAHEALAQNHDGLLRLANAWPADWEAIAWLPVEGGHRVALEVVAGVVQAAAVDLGSSNATMRIRNPWSGQSFAVRDLTSASTLFSGTQDVATVAAVTGHRLLIERDSQPLSSLTFDAIVDTPNSGPTVLGTRTLGKAAGDTFGFSAPRLFDWRLGNISSGLVNLGSVTNADLRAEGTVIDDSSFPSGTGLSLASGYLRTDVLGQLGSDVGATMQLDVKVNATAGYRRLLDYCVPGSNCDTGFLLDVTPDHKVRFICSSQTVVSSGVLPLDTWAHLRVAYLSGNWVSIEIDGVSEIIPVAGNWINLSSESLHLSIGADLGGGSRFTGSVANVRIDAGVPVSTESPLVIIVR